MANARDAHLARLQEEIAARLRPVCGQWPEELFDEMIRGLAALTLKYESGLPLSRARATESLGTVAGVVTDEHAAQPDQL